VLNSPAILTLMQVFDFCENHAQKKVITLCHNVSRHATSEEQFNNQVLPVLQWIFPKIVVERYGSDQKTSEQVAQIVLNIINSMNNFFSPTKDNEKYVLKFETVMNTGLTETICSCLSDYAVTSNSNKISHAEDEDEPMESFKIETGAASGTQDLKYTEQTISAMLQILCQGCRFSHLLIAQMLHGNVLRIITNLLPEDSQSQNLPAYINDLISLLNLVLP